MANKIENKKQIQKDKKNVKTKVVKVTQDKKRLQNQKRKNVKQADDKSARVKKARNPRKLLTWTILMAMLIGILVFLSKSELFEVCKIEITGSNQISQETLIKLSGIDLGDNVFLSNTIKAENKISDNPYVKEVKIKRVLPDKIKIEVVEKQKTYMIATDEKVAYVDENGSILEVSNTKLDELITLQGYSTSKEKIESAKTLNEEDIERLEDLQKILKSGEKIDLQSKIASINIQDKNDYVLNLPEYKKLIYIGDTSNLANKILYIEAILEKSQDVEGKIFVNGNLNKGFDPYFREEPNN